MLTLRHIIMWERLQHRPFSSFNGANIDDVTALMYCHDTKNQRRYTLQVYQAASPNTGELQTFAREISNDLQFVGQFSSDSESENDDKAKHPECNFTEIFQMLVFRGGINAEWLLSQSLELLPVLVKGLEDQYHFEQSDKKFWTLLMMSPHMTEGGQRKLRNSLTFDWEKKKIHRLTDEEEMALGPALFRGIMKKTDEVQPTDN